ncbi:MULTISPECIES: SIR2 family protein [unclassified Mesorhizobium]|uniref:SIR2 family protein n=1 Tax=unclassified Mesorhizobium TaxID=325217 RepID=UPI0016770EEA|nr:MULTISPECIES: SIR2 family protein [unclassified Mesorhizobium]
MSDSILPIPAIPPGLKEAAARGVLIPFIGAGASVLTGCPSWVKLADGALTQCIAANKFSYAQLAQIEHLSPRIKLSIARGLEAEHQFKINYDNLINPAVGYDNNELGHRVYRSLSKLGETFVTTNYDAWLDIDIPDVKISTSPVDKVQTTTAARPTKRRAIYRVNEFTPANLNQPRTVFHLHGSLVDPKGMVVTTRDYITRYANDRADDDPELENRTLTFLSHLFSTKTVLFVGYGLEDLEILEYVIQKARVPSPEGKPEARHFMLQGFFSHQMELMRSLSSYYQQFDIQLLPFQRDKKDWHQLIDVLEHFSEAMPARSPLNLQKQAEMEALLD